MLESRPRPRLLPGKTAVCEHIFRVAAQRTEQ